MIEIPLSPYVEGGACDATRSSSNLTEQTCSTSSGHYLPSNPSFTVPTVGTLLTNIGPTEEPIPNINYVPTTDPSTISDPPTNPTTYTTSDKSLDPTPHSNPVPSVDPTTRTNYSPSMDPPPTIPVPSADPTYVSNSVPSQDPTAGTYSALPLDPASITISATNKFHTTYPDPVSTLDPSPGSTSNPTSDPTPRTTSVLSGDPAPSSTSAPTMDSTHISTSDPASDPTPQPTSDPPGDPMPCTTSLPTGDPTPSATSVPTLDIAPLFVTTPSGDITLAGPHTAAQARNPHRGRTTILRRRLWQHSVSGRHSILEARLRGTTTNTACLPGQRRSWGTDVMVRQCRARNLRHIMRYQLALLCPGFDPLPPTGQLRRRRPRRGKRRAHRPKHRPSVPTQLRLRSDYIPTTTHYTSPQPCLQATYTRPTETVITTYKVSNMRAIPNCSRPPPVGRYLSSRQKERGCSVGKHNCLSARGCGFESHLGA